MVKYLEQMPACHRRAFFRLKFDAAGDVPMIVDGHYTLEKRLEAI